MQITGTREAFEALIQERGIYKRLGVERSTVATWKIYLKKGKNISLDKMVEMLLKAGASVVQEKIWEVGPIKLPKDNKRGFAIGDFVQFSKRGIETYVHSKLEGVFTVVGLFNGSCTVVSDKGEVHSSIDVEGDLIEPILLTDEWLKKLGISERIVLNGDWYDVWSTQVNEDDDDPEFGYCFAVNNEELRVIKYVHELQNLYFALTGEELLIVS